MRFAFVTCVQIGLSCIEKIYESGHKLELVITLNDNNSTKRKTITNVDYKYPK